MHMIRSKKFTDKKVLLVDRVLKKSNDRTWCFWQKESDFFENIVCKRWNKLLVADPTFSKELHISPYVYKMIRAIDFYDYCFKEIGQQKNFQVISGNVETLFNNEQPGVKVNGQAYFSDYVFNSILFEKPKLSDREIWILQHFKGWHVQTEHDAYDATAATIMDFREDQNLATSFCYLLPFNSRQALVEYTLLSEQLLEESQYVKRLQRYIHDTLNISSYEIIGEEFGSIPMTNFTFPRHNNGVVQIGTAGGQTKGSSGYTYNFIQKHSKAIVDALI